MRIAPLPSSLDPPNFEGATPAALRPRERRSFSAVLEDRPTGSVPAAGRVTLAVLARATDGERAVDDLVRAAARGRTFTPGQLLAAQATVSRYAQTVEVVSRAADRLVGAIKQTIGTQI
jgi:hypothetical protein